MKRLLIVAAITASSCAVAVPAFAGLAGNPSFSHRIPVTIPSRAVQVHFDDHGRALDDATPTPGGTPTSTTKATPAHTESPGDRHGNPTRVEPGDDNGGNRTSTEPGDDNGGTRTGTEPGDDNHRRGRGSGGPTSSAPTSSTPTPSPTGTDDHGGRRGGGDDDGSGHR